MKEITLAEAAARTGLSPSTLKHQARSGRLKARLVSRTYVVSERELARYMRDHARRPVAPESELELRAAWGDR